MKNIKKHIPLVLILLFQIPLFLPFFKHGFFPTHDNVQVVRIFEFYQSLVYGKTPPSWSSGLLYGHGYPLFSFYSPLVYLIGAIFSVLGLNFLLATKATFILSFLVGALGFFLLVKHLYGNFPAVVSTIIYSLAPYRAVDVYVRGNLAEFFALSIFPYLFLYNYKLLQNQNRKNLLLLSIFICLLILTHNISIFIYMIFLFLYNILYIVKNNKQAFNFVKSFLLACILALGYSSFYWFPLLIERKYVILDNFSRYPYDTFFITLSSLWKSNWGYGGFHQPNPMSLQLGQTLTVITCLSFLISLFSKKSKHNYEFKIIAILFSVFTFLELKQSNFVWQIIGIFSYIQFPWRFHIVTTTTASICVAYFLFLIKKSKKFSKNITLLFVSLILIFFSLNESFKYFRPIEYTQEPAVSETTTWDDEYLPKWVSEKPKDYAPNKVIGTDQDNIKNLSWGYHKKSFQINLSQFTKISIAHIYYPGWTCFVNGIETNITYQNPNGLMEIVLPPGRHQVEFIYKNTWWRSLSQFISLSSIILTIFYVTKYKQNK